MVESGDSPDVTLDKSLDPHFRTMITGFLSTAARCTQGFFRRQGRRALNAKDVQFPFLSFLAYVIFRDGSLVPLRPHPLLFFLLFSFALIIRSEASAVFGSCRKGCRGKLDLQKFEDSSLFSALLPAINIANCFIMRHFHPTQVCKLRT